jgi:hypothetical protein
MEEHGRTWKNMEEHGKIWKNIENAPSENDSKGTNAQTPKAQQNLDWRRADAKLQSDQREKRSRNFSDASFSKLEPRHCAMNSGAIFPFLGQPDGI